jgi:hypothetical protein
MHGSDRDKPELENSQRFVGQKFLSRVVAARREWAGLSALTRGLLRTTKRPIGSGDGSSVRLR